MLISLEQCQILLSEGMIEKIQQLFKAYNCSDIKLYDPQSADSDDEGKINFYVKDDQGEMDYFTAGWVSANLKKILQREDVTLSIDSLINPTLKPDILKSYIPFDRPNLEKIYDSLNDFDIKKQAAVDGKTRVIIEFSPSVHDNTIEELIKNYRVTTKEKIHDASKENQFEAKPYSAKIF